MPTLSFLLTVCLLAFSACAADAPEGASSPATQPAGLAGKIAILSDGRCAAEITISNPTDHALSIGYFVSYSLIRTDTTPPQTIAASPAHSMRPNFRILLGPGDSKTSTLTLSETALPPGHYRFTITYPIDMFANPLEKEFDIGSAAATNPK